MTANVILSPKIDLDVLTKEPAFLTSALTLQAFRTWRATGEGQTRRSQMIRSVAACEACV